MGSPERGGGQRKVALAGGLVAKAAPSRPGGVQRGESSARLPGRVLGQARSRKNGAGAVFSKPVPVSSKGTGQELPLPGMTMWKLSCTPIRLDQYKCVSGGEVFW